MKKVMNVVLATIILTSLTACMVVPPRVEYVGPRIGIVAPYPVYQQSYYGEPMRPYRYHHSRDRGW